MESSISGGRVKALGFEAVATCFRPAPLRSTTQDVLFALRLLRPPPRRSKIGQRTDEIEMSKKASTSGDGPRKDGAEPLH